MQIGFQLGAFAGLDTGLALPTSSNVTGATKDLGAGNRKPVRLRARFSSSQTGITNKQSIEVRAQWSSDGTNWPDITEGDYVFSWDANAVGLAAGADLIKSTVVTFSPKERYFRFRIRNFNANDALVFGSEVAEDYVTDTN